MAGAQPKTLFRAVLVALAVPLWTACDRAAPADEPAADSMATPAAPAENPDITALRTKFQPLQDFAQASPAGYTEAITSCWFHKDNGGQGVHYARTSLIDSMVVMMDPEIVMYEPQQGGGQQLVGIEYIVPFDQWKATTPPTVLGEQLHRNEALSLWVLHAWLYRDNPSGMFADWNPNVSCANAAQSEDRSTVTAPPAP
jgi:hypothetical protein